MTEERTPHALLPAAILAGGLASRLRPLTDKIPKALLEIGGEPFLAHQLRLLRGRGLSRVVVCTGYRGEMIEEYLGDGSRFGLEASYSHDGPLLLGTGGALRKALPLLGDRFFVLYGDSYLTCDYREAQDAFFLSGKPALMTVYRNEGQWDTSNVRFEGGRILNYDKTNRTSKMRHIDYGLGLFAASAFSNVPDDRPTDLAYVYQQLLEAGELAGFEVHQRFYEIGSLSGIADLTQYLSSPSKVTF